MSAVLREFAAAPALHVVPSMTEEPPKPPTPLGPERKIVNTLKCQAELCGLPLVGVTKRRRFVPLHGEIHAVYKEGDATKLVASCPMCRIERIITVR